MPLHDVAFCGLCLHCDVDRHVCELYGSPVEISSPPCGDYEYWAQCVVDELESLKEIYEE